jgi:acetamidase/formamidase
VRSSTQVPSRTTPAAPPATVAWGYYWSKAKPVLTVHSGDTVRMQTLSTCGPNERLVSEGATAADIPTYNQPIYDKVTDKGPGGHILTGPVAIAEAQPGDVLEIDILKIDIDAPFACNGFGVGRGFLPDDFPYGRSKIIPLDRDRMIAHFAPGIDIPLHPFFGSMGDAPPDSAGRYNSAPPWMHGGNMDNKELVAGTTLYLPVHAPGALFEAGDGHAGQGNGEVDITAMETFLTGTFRFVVHKEQHLLWPQRHRRLVDSRQFGEQGLRLRNDPRRARPCERGVDTGDHSEIFLSVVSARRALEDISPRIEENVSGEDLHTKPVTEIAPLIGVDLYRDESRTELLEQHGIA